MIRHNQLSPATTGLSIFHVSVATTQKEILSLFQNTTSLEQTLQYNCYLVTRNTVISSAPTTSINQTSQQRSQGSQPINTTQPNPIHSLPRITNLSIRQRDNNNTSSFDNDPLPTIISPRSDDEVIVAISVRHDIARFLASDIQYHIEQIIQTKSSSETSLNDNNTNIFH